MKSSYLPATQWIVAMLILLDVGNSHAQRSITWKGGTSGMKNDWFCPQNWSTSSVPDEFSDVIIPDVSTSTFATPVIKSGEVEINSLQILSNAMLTIEKAATVVINSRVTGLTSVNIQGEGQMILEDHSNQRFAKLVADQSH